MEQKKGKSLTIQQEEVLQSKEYGKEKRGTECSVFPCAADRSRSKSKYKI